MRVSLPRLSVVHLRRRRSVLAVLVGVAILLELAAGAGLAYVAGWSRVRAVLGDFDGIWLIALVGALLVSFVGYYYAYRGIFRVEGGPALPRRRMRAVVAAGFGGFLAHGGGALDQYALQAAGAEEDEAKARVAALGGLEHGVLAIGGCAAAIAVLVSGRGQPPADFTVPWAVIPIPGFVVGFWAAGRYGDRFRCRAGWRGKLGIWFLAPQRAAAPRGSGAALGAEFRTGLIAAAARRTSVHPHSPRRVTPVSQAKTLFRIRDTAGSVPCSGLLQAGPFG